VRRVLLLVVLASTLAACSLRAKVAVPSFWQGQGTESGPLTLPER
jgi:hypothetical protein